MPPLLNEEESALDPYVVLGLTSEAGEGDIKKAYRKMSLKYHPDKNSTPEGAVMFRKITVSLEILSDTSKRTYIDTRQGADRAKKERYAEMNKKKRVMVDALVAREEEAKRARVDLAKRQKEENEEENIKEAGRKMLEEAQKRAMARAQAEARAAEAKAATSIPGASTSTYSNGSTSRPNGAPDISSVDLTLVLIIPSTIPLDNLESRITTNYGPLAHYILRDAPTADVAEGVKKKKVKSRRAVVEFAKGNWGGCWACWKDHQQHTSSSQLIKDAGREGPLGVGVKAKWAGGEEPAWVAWAARQIDHGARNGTNGSNGTNETRSNGSSEANGSSQSVREAYTQTREGFSQGVPGFEGPTSTSFDSAPDFGSTSMADLLASHAKSQNNKQEKKKQDDEYESMTLLRMRQMERERLEAQIRAEEDD